MSTIPTGQFILINKEILNDSSLILPNNHTQGKKTNLSFFARDDDSKRMWNFIKGSVMRCWCHLFNIYYLTTWRPMTTNAIRHVFLKGFSLNILFLNKAWCTTWVSGALAALGFFVCSFLAWIQCFPCISPHSWYPHIHEDVTFSEKPYKLCISWLHSLLPESCSQELMHRAHHSPSGLLSQHTLNWEAYKQWNLICHNSRDWQVQDPGAGRSG